MAGKVAEVNRMDGLKLIFGDGSWVLMRPSGTEPVVRFYAESTTPGRSGNAARIRKAMGQRKIMQGLVSRIAVGVFGLLTVAMILLAVFDERGALALGKRREELQNLNTDIDEDRREEQGAPKRDLRSPSRSRCNRTPCARATEARQARRDCHRDSADHGTFEKRSDQSSQSSSRTH